MNEIWIYNIFGFLVNNIFMTMGYGLLVLLIVVILCFEAINARTTIGTLLSLIGILATVSVMVLGGQTFGDISTSLKSYDSKYYISKNVPVTRYSLEDKQFETKDGRVIKNAKVITTTTIKTKKPKVKLKEYKLKKKWYGMHGVKKTSYYAYVLQPAKKVETVKD